MCMCICYIDCHEAGPCCYLVIHIGNLLCPLQLFASICDLFVTLSHTWNGPLSIIIR
jgi:hypothetical protein